MESTTNQLGRAYLEGCNDMMDAFVGAMSMVQIRTAKDNPDINAFCAVLQEVIIKMKKDVNDKFVELGVIDG